MSNISEKQHFYIPLSELTDLTILKASHQKHSSWQLHSKKKKDLQQFQMERCQPIKRLKEKKKILYLQHLKGRVVFILRCLVLYWPKTHWSRLCNRCETNIKINYRNRSEKNMKINYTSTSRSIKNIKIDYSSCRSRTNIKIKTGDFMSNISEKQHFYNPLSELTYLTILEASRQKHSSWHLHSKEKMTCNSSRWKVANQSKDWRKRRRLCVCSI